MWGVDLSIQDAEGHILATGEQGEVCARAGNFMDCYWNRPKETEEAFRDGWYHSGDMGYLDKEGYLYLVDRVKDMIVTGGENVYSVEVENAIASHPAVEQVAVIWLASDDEDGGGGGRVAWIAGFIAALGAIALLIAIRVNVAKSHELDPPTLSVIAPLPSGTTVTALLRECPVTGHTCRLVA